MRSNIWTRTLCGCDNPPVWWRCETDHNVVLRFHRGCLLAEKIEGQDLLVDSFAGKTSLGLHRGGCNTSAYGWCVQYRC